MKLKFKLITVFAALGVASSGFAAWNFATDTSNEVNIQVGIEAATGSIGSIDFDDIGIYNLADTPNPLVFNATFTPGSGIDLSKVDLTYKVTLNSALADLISFGALSEGYWVSDAPTSITPTWNAGKNPSDLAAYNAIKNNLANLSMNVSLSAKMKDGTELVPPDTVVPSALPDGLVEGPGGLIEYNKDLGPLQFVVHGLNAGGETAGVDQSFMWESSDPSRASVANGLVTPLSDGNVTISATPSSFAGKGLKKAENEKPQALFHLNITGFTVIPPEPVATKIELVLGADVVNEMVLEIGDEINVSARVLDENNNVMPELVIDHELYDADSATYVAGVIKAIAAVEDNYIEFTYEELSVTFYFSIAALPVVEPAFILINGGVALEVPFAQGSGTLVAEVYDADYNVLEGEAVTWSVPNNNVISIVAETGAYTINNAGQVLVTAKSVTNQYIFATLELTVLEPPVLYHTITFVYDNGQPNGSQQVAHNDSLVKPVNPTREGYTFVGWTLDGESYDFGDAVLSDLILKATWTKNTYTVVFDTDGGAPVPAERNIEHGEVMDEPENPTKEGFSFVSWYVGETAYQWTTPVTSSFTLTAHWEVIQYTVIFNTGDGTSVEPQTVNHGAKATKPEDPVQAGSDFAGWKLGGVAYDFNTPVTEDLVLVAEWTDVSPVDEDIIFLDFDESNIFNVTTGKNYMSYPNVTYEKDGVFYNFALENVRYLENNYPDNDFDPYFYLMLESVNGSISGTAPEGKYVVELAAHFGAGSANNGSATFTFSGGEGENVVHVGTSLKDLTEIAENDNQTHDQFSIKSTGGNLQLQSLNIIYADIEGYVPQVKHTVTFDTLGGSAVAEQRIVEGQKAVKPVDPTKEGFDFVEWKHNGVTYDFNTPVNAAITLVADWKVHESGGQTGEIPATTPGTSWLKVNNVGQLTPGKYVFMGESNSKNVMGTSRAGSYQDRVSLSTAGNNTDLSGNTINTELLVWELKSTGTNEFTINSLKDGSSGYLSWSSGNSVAYGSTVQSWVLSANDGLFTVANKNTSERILSYNANSGQERFAAYGNTNQKRVTLYRYDADEVVPEFGILDSIELGSPANKLNFNTGDTFSSAGLSLIAKDNSSPAVIKSVEAGFTTNFDGVTFNESHVGEQNVVVRYSEGTVEKTLSYKINVVAASSLKTFTQITSEDDLNIGATYVIGGLKGEETWVMTTTQNGNNRGAEAATMEGGNIKETPTVQKFELVAGSIAGTYAFKIVGGTLNGQYIYAAGGTGNSNYLRTQATLTDSASFVITFVDGVASVVAQGNVVRNTLKFNATQTPLPIFSCYGTGQSPVALYLDTSYSG